MLYLKIPFINWVDFWHADSDAITFYYTHTLLYILNFGVKAGGPMHLYSCTSFSVSFFWYPGIWEFLDSVCKCWMLDSGCWTLDFGLIMLYAGLWTLDATVWMLGSGYCRLSLFVQNRIRTQFLILLHSIIENSLRANL